MRLLDWLDKILPGSSYQTTASLTKGIRKQYVEDYKERAKMVDDIAKSAHAYDQLAVPLSGKHDWAGLGIIDDPYIDEAQKGKCLWCTTPYEDEGASCTKCGAPKDVREIEAVIPMMSST